MKLFSGSAPAAGTLQQVHNRRGLEKIAVQASATTSATTEIQGRMGADHTWLTLATLTDSDGDTVAWFPQMRANVTAVSGQLEVDLAGN